MFGLISDAANVEINGKDKGVESDALGVTRKIFLNVINLRTGEALLFAPNSAMTIDYPRSENRSQRLRFSYLKIKVRTRLTADGGKSIMSN